MDGNTLIHLDQFRAAGWSLKYGLRTFKRRFKDATGETPMQFLQILRLEQGKDMLRHTHKNVAEVAWAVGYGDPRHFNRLFKRHFGTTPARWRKKT